MDICNEVWSHIIHINKTREKNKDIVGEIFTGMSHINSTRLSAENISLVLH